MARTSVDLSCSGGAKFVIQKSEGNLSSSTVGSLQGHLKSGIFSPSTSILPAHYLGPGSGSACPVFTSEHQVSPPRLSPLPLQQLWSSCTSCVQNCFHHTRLTLAFLLLLCSSSRKPSLTAYCPRGPKSKDKELSTDEPCLEQTLELPGGQAGICRARHLVSFSSL